MTEDRIKEKMVLKFPKPITIEGTEKILDQTKNCVFKIILEDGVRGTGFFCNIPYNNKKYTSYDN